tara:strand:- start:223 stop:654 length:432 start_codon:yes stop_codon:yes gene_type:complete
MTNLSDNLSNEFSDNLSADVSTYNMLSNPTNTNSLTNSLHEKEDENIHHFSIKDKQNIMETISKLNKIEHIEIFKIFKNHHVKFTENSNGIFINLSKVPDVILYEVTLLLRFYEKNNKHLNEYAKKKTVIKNNYFNSDKIEYT